MKQKQTNLTASVPNPGIQSGQVFPLSNAKAHKKLARVQYEMEVNASPEKAWEVLASYGDVAHFHPQLESSQSLNGSHSKASLGCERECVIPDGKKKIVVRERVTDFVEGQYYTYHVYEWENFPLNTMYNTFGVKTNGEGKTFIYQITNYRLRPAFLTGLMKWKLRSSARDSLLGYKHFIETGEKKANIKEVRKRYKNA